MAKAKQTEFFEHDGTCPITGERFQSITDIITEKTNAARKKQPAKRAKINAQSRERDKQKRAAAKQEQH